MDNVLKVLISSFVLIASSVSMANDVDGELDVECRTVADKSVSKSNYRSMLLEAKDTDGNIMKSKRYTWGMSTFAHYVDSDTHVEIEYKTGKRGFKILENGTFRNDGYVSPEAALLIMRLQAQIDDSSTRQPHGLINTTVNCDVAWTGAEPLLSSCYLTPAVDAPRY